MPKETVPKKAIEIKGITIANSDSGATAYSDVAIDQGYRAVAELFNEGSASPR